MQTKNKDKAHSYIHTCANKIVGVLTGYPTTSLGNTSDFLIEFFALCEKSKLTIGLKRTGKVYNIVGDC